MKLHPYLFLLAFLPAMSFFSTTTSFAKDAKKTKSSASDASAIGSVEVSGLSCPFCAFGLEKKLKELPFVKKVTIFVDEGRAEFSLKKGATPDFEAAKKAVVTGGFTPGATAMKAIGVVRVENEHIFLLVDGGLRIALLDDAGLQKLKSALQKINNQKAKVKLSGTAQMQGAQVAVSIAEFEVLK